MANDKNIIIFKCPNKECGKRLKVSYPAKSGIYTLTCPYCKHQFRANCPAKPGAQSQPKDNGVPDNSAKPPKNMGEFPPNTREVIVCPHCNKQKIAFSYPTEGEQTFSCPKCKGVIAVEIRGHTYVVTDTVTSSSPFKPVKGRLRLVRKMRPSKKYTLPEGTTIVGRYDEDTQSDLAIKGDSSISRRSVKIEVEREAAGYTFKMTVLKATNPVLHNNAPLHVGDTVYLNFGDTITLGTTVLHFEKDV